MEQGSIEEIRLLGKGAGISIIPNKMTPLARKALKELSEYFSGKRRRFLIKPVISGTPFAKSVLRALSKIPYGHTITYAELAIRVGHPGAARAVGAVMASNRVPIILPCHRVVAKNGIGGYSAGLGWKKYLLKIENIEL